ncbi:hypothetical protein AB6A40_004211 [Gnathostoma spinigerum]|uniref:EF-hand domain-containing protein n=1 Tax=Gnathostoma spinigerum TaxID=75299 RepID=A0ABD6EDZ8_9BILA
MRPGRRVDDSVDSFVDSLRILFDVLDINRTGYISYKQMCNRWRELGPPKQIPHSFLSCAARLAQSDGLLSFESFVEAARMAIAESRFEKHRTEMDGFDNGFDKKRIGPTMGLNGLDRRYTNGVQPTVPGSNGNNEGIRIVMRQKKNIITNGQPHSRVENNVTRTEQRRPTCVRFRPMSTNSTTSIASSGMSDVRWRNSHIPNVSSNSTSANGVPNPSSYSKNERFLEEEKDLIQRGVDTANKLLLWYSDRLDSLQKRRRLIRSGIVAVDAAVQEQRLDFLRAHISELNRRSTSLMESSERGFPTHSNLQVKTQMPQPNDDAVQYLQRQNRLLTQELFDKDQMIEQLKKERNDVVNHNNSVASSVRMPHPQRHSAIYPRPAALVRPAPQHSSMFRAAEAASCTMKVHDTLM